MQTADVSRLDGAAVPLGSEADAAAGVLLDRVAAVMRAFQIALQQMPTEAELRLLGRLGAKSAPIPRAARASIRLLLQQLQMDTPWQPGQRMTLQNFIPNLLDQIDALEALVAA